MGPRELRPGAHLEARVLAAQSPDDFPGLLIDQIGSPGMAHTDENVAVGKLLDRVGVKEVGCLAWDIPNVAVADRHVAQGVPLPDHLVCGHIDLPDDPVERRSIGRASH